MKTKITLLTLTAIMLIMLAACGAEEPPAMSASSLESAQDIGQGSRIFRFEVTDDTETVTVWNVHTDDTTVGEALLAIGLIDGDVSEFGLYVKKVDGLIADYDANQSWWAFFIDGEMAMTGVDFTDIEEGVTYAFVYTSD